MFGTFILGAAAGWLAPYAEPQIKAVLARALPEETAVAPREWAQVSLVVCLLAAAILSMIISNPHAVALALGALAGVAGPKLIDRWRSGTAPDYDS